LPSRVIRTTGEATVSAKPDRASLTIGVVTQAASAQATAARNATESESMLESLRHSLCTAAEIRTSGYTLIPNFTNRRNGGQAVLSGYTASNTVENTTDDLANVGKVIDAATAAGANNARSLGFVLKDEAPVRAQALREAARKARASAQSMAAALGLKRGVRAFRRRKRTAGHAAQAHGHGGQRQCKLRLSNQALCRFRPR